MDCRVVALLLLAMTTDDKIEKIFDFMKIIKISKEINELTNSLKSQGKTIAFVPTMGFLHEGHLTLVRKAKELADIVVVSIFVNEKQFNNKNDFANYPIDLKSDLEKLENESVDIVFAPNNDEIYPKDFTNPEIYLEQKMTDILCGKSRPGHFEGVCLVLRRLFDLINPDFAVFGLKDFQQFVVVKTMVDYFNLPIKIVGVEIVREDDGLAMSSRNYNLTKENRVKASQIYKIMLDAKNAVKKTGNINLILHNSIKELEKNKDFRVDYFEARKEDDLSLIENYDELVPIRLFVAVFVGEVRLIDNLGV